MTDQKTKGEVFRALHESGCFIIPNPWDAGSAKLMAGLGFRALASTSSGFARSTGVNDYELTRAQVISHVADLCAATDLPVSADLENGFGHAPEDCAETIKLGADAGLVGGSIEDFNGVPGEQYELSLATDRVAAAVEAARGQPFPFTLTARAENHFTGNGDLADTITRLQAYQDAGADVLYAPGLKTKADIQAVLSSVDRPINVLMGPKAGLLPVSELADMGVRRISVGGAFANVAVDAVIKAGRELLDSGTFGFLDGVAPASEIIELMFGNTKP
ncbi:MAG: isocitrate lyase/phosphoenolpyruvate mutase family protein [Alphaproteobacteria bacterium]|nr:isocitrate lyase/phosphoenolpyruvate mutase family protein [Alphaproteobacteria bacterium]